MSPLVIADLFEQGKLGLLMEERETPRATVIIADVRGFTPHTLDYERGGRSLRRVAELLERFFDDALETVFEYNGVMGEFSGDKFMAIFGVPIPRPEDADRAVMAALDIYDNASRLNRHLRMTRQHHLAFDIGIGISTGGPVWVGDIGSDWRRELTMIGTAINVASRVEELTKAEEFSSVPGYNIILRETTVDSLSPEVSSHLELQEFSPRQLRGLGETEYRVFKLINYDQRGMPSLRERIDTATQAVVDAIAQIIESVQEREESLRLGLTMQDIGQAISSSLQLDDILESVMDGVQVFLYATTASLLLIEEGSNRLRFKAARPRENMPILQSFEDDLELGTGIVGHVAATGESLCLFDAQRDPRFYSKPDTRTGFQTRSVLCTPIRLEGEIIGVIQVIDSQEGKFSRDDLRVLEAIAAFTVSAIRNARQHMEVAEAEMLASMSIVTSDIAHALKNDVGLIQWVSQSLLEKLAEPKAELDKAFLRRRLQRISRRAKQLLDTMDEIRYPFSELKLEETDLRALLESTLESLLATTDQSESIDIQRNYRELPVIVTDKARLSGVFFKVIENAIKAMKDSSHRVLTLELWRPEPSRVRIGIADTGPGISPEKKSHLFRPVQRQTDESGGGGWGYGLWSSRLFLRSLGGTIFLDEVHSNGTRMVIDLPLKSVAPGRMEDDG
jgi:signal transduction histidine kinase